MLVAGDACEGRAFEYIDYMGTLYLSNIFHEFKVTLKDPLYLKRKINEINQEELEIEHQIHFKYVSLVHSFFNELFNNHKGVASQAPLDL
jgi:hypothetical protein